MDRQSVARILVLINHAYPNFVTDRVKAESWLKFLENVPYELAHKNLLHHIRTSRFIPTIADISKPEHDPEHYTDYRQLKSETDKRLDEMERWKRAALPPGGRWHE
ncbi:replicative helicase loader/inhibitor [Paenibacillus sp. GbtcB18]|uniref:replicative helicase loader/inhibitor n=1 Tax=Paenibacillus sp. GbtcB18 TaxID=2824763 RepID=UPI001C2FF940